MRRREDRGASLRHGGKPLLNPLGSGPVSCVFFLTRSMLSRRTFRAASLAAVIYPRPRARRSCDHLAVDNPNRQTRVGNISLTLQFSSPARS